LLSTRGTLKRREAPGNRRHERTAAFSAMSGV
jgi:hypothetical protein